jgi:hypothetical protein
MNEFDRRWKLGVTAARTAERPRDETMPLGFVTRVLANRAAASGAGLMIWQQLALRVCIALAILVAALASLNALSSDEGDALRPNIESTVDDLFWAL